MQIVGNDARYAWRMLMRRPAFSVAALAALSLGLGTNAAMFSVIDAVLLKPLPYGGSENLVALSQVDVARDGAETGLIAPATFLDWRDSSTSFEALALVRPWSFTDTTTGEPDVFPAGLVSLGFFETLGVPPAIGRLLIDQDYQKGVPKTAVISDKLWRARFGADSGIVGRTVRFEDGPVTIVGVLPREFYWLDHDQVMWAPYVISEKARSERQQTYLRAVGRLKNGVAADQAVAEAIVLSGRLKKTYPDVYRTVDLRIDSIEAAVTSGVRDALIVLFAAVGLILVIACANVASLMLARSAERQREFSVRIAVGAGPGQLARQLLTESVLLALLGTISGLLLAYWSIDMIVAMTPSQVPRLDQTTLNWRVAVFTGSLAICVAALIGLGPALHARRDVILALRTATSTAHGGAMQLRQWFVASEIAVTFVLLIGAGLLVQSLARLTNVDTGFRFENAVMLETSAWSAFPKPDGQRLFFSEVLKRLRGTPGVLEAGAVTALPFLGDSSIEMETSVKTLGSVDPSGPATAWLSIATRGYFETLEISLVEGRLFGDQDRGGSTPVAVVSEGFARRRLGADPVGGSILVANNRTPKPLQVIGVVRDVRHLGFDSAAREEIYVPLDQAPFGSMNIVVRTAGDPLTLVPSIKSVIRTVNPKQTFGTVASLEQLAGITLAPRRFYLGLALVLAAVALVLAMVGLYGTMTLLATQRTREIGVRVALGGTRREILWLVLRSGIAAPMIGAAFGAAAAFASSRVLSAYLFGITPTDASTFLVVALVLLLTSFLAAVMPTRRAMRVDPIIALREE